MSKYSSLSRWNNMQFQEDWSSIQEWRDARCLYIGSTNIEWSILVCIETGQMVDSSIKSK